MSVSGKRREGKKTQLQDDSAEPHSIKGLALLVLSHTHTHTDRFAFIGHLRDTSLSFSLVFPPSNPKLHSSSLPTIQQGKTRSTIPTPQQNHLDPFRKKRTKRCFLLLPPLRPRLAIGCPWPLHGRIQESDQPTGKNSTETGYRSRSLSLTTILHRHPPPPQPPPQPRLSTVKYPLVVIVSTITMTTRCCWGPPLGPMPCRRHQICHTYLRMPSMIPDITTATIISSTQTRIPCSPHIRTTLGA